jgi:hypothetical protein
MADVKNLAIPLDPVNNVRSMLRTKAPLISKYMGFQEVGAIGSKLIYRNLAYDLCGAAISDAALNGDVS